MLSPTLFDLNNPTISDPRKLKILPVINQPQAAFSNGADRALLDRFKQIQAKSGFVSAKIFSELRAEAKDFIQIFHCIYSTSHK